LIFSRAGTLRKYEKFGVLDIVRKKVDNEVEVRILIGTDKPTSEREETWLREYPKLGLRYLNKTIHTNLTTVDTDRELSRVSEEKKTKMTLISV
jgi:hypothetical protein